MRNGASRSRLREYNARTVIHALRRGGPASQSEIAERTGLSVPAVSAIMRSLTDVGRIREVRSDNPGRGRPRVIVDIVPDAAYSLGIHVDPSLITVVLLDLRGNVVQADHSPEVDPADPASALEAASRMARDVTPAGPLADRVVGACLAVPGRVDPGIGGIADSVWLPGWNGRPLGSALAESIGREVSVVKDTYAAMVGEQWVRGGELLEVTSVFVYLGVGTGLGLCVAGEPSGGTTGNAGETGRIFTALDRGETATMQDPANLVATAHRRRILPGPPPGPGDLRRLDADFRTLCAAAADGHDAASTLLREAGTRVVAAAGIAADLLDARCVVLGGPYWDALEPLYGPIAREALGAPTTGKPGVQVLSSAQGTDAGAIGAASTVLDAQFVPRTPR